MQNAAWDASIPNPEDSSKQTFPSYVPSVLLIFRPVSPTHKIVARALLVSTTSAAG